MPNSKRLYQKIGQQLKNQILAGTYPIGSRLLPEREIAEQFKVSRTLIREALIMLELEGLINIKKGSGVYIIKLPSLNNSQNNLIENNSLGLNEEDYGPFEVLQARQIIESSIAAAAATQVTKADIAEMRKVLLDEKQAILAGGTGEENDQRFHYLIARATQNEMMLEILEKMWRVRINSPMWVKLHEHIEDKNYRKQWLLDHENILNALQKKDPAGARQAMWQHIENVKEILMKLSDVDDPDFDGYLFESIPYKTLFQ
ncbi:fructuronate-inducible hexuronate regulon transcriptional repressor [Gammaproteobacteria bacterium]|nr:fructuronate-inducible hexuronate regulon transcriptional repressor [Gammaproteobacteria bacterium]